MHDLTKDDNTMKYVRSSTKIIEEMEGDGDILVGFSEIIERWDHDLGENINEINERFKRFCNNKGSLL